MSDKQARLIIISAPSGGGKNTVINKALEFRPDIALSISATTRAPRVGEVDGKQYFFVSHEKFLEMIEQNEFLEYAKYVGEYYGTPKAPINEFLAQGRDCILEIEVQGAKQVMALTPEHISIFIVPPDMAVLESRLRGRGTDSDEKLAARLERARAEMEERVNYMHVVVNDDIDRAAQELLAIIGAEK